MHGEILRMYALAWNVPSKYFPSFEKEHRRLPSDERCRVHKNLKNFTPNHSLYFYVYICVILLLAISRMRKKKMLG